MAPEQERIKLNEIFLPISEIIEERELPVLLEIPLSGTAAQQPNSPSKKYLELGYELDTDPRVFDHAESKSELKKLKIEFLAKSPKLGSFTNPVYSGRME